jgi:heterotetrameric sarcosine oxidase gamma subunit
MTTPTKLTPLCQIAQSLGAKFVEMGGWRFAESYTSIEAEMAAARDSVALADVTPHGKLQIEGAAALDVLRGAFSAVPESIGHGIQVEAGYLYRLRHDQFYLSTPPGGESKVFVQLEAAVVNREFFVTVTDMTHGLADIRMIGPASRAVLSQLCGLDFTDEAFPNMTAKQTSLAKTKQLILRRDFGALPTYTIIGAQSLAAYLWDVMMEAGHDFGIAPIGVAALRELET